MLAYPVLNLPRRYLGQAAPPPQRYMPTATDCASLPDFQKALDNASQRIAYYEKAMQAATAANDQTGIDAASAGSDLANRDWNTWSAKVKSCQAGAGKGPVSTSVVGPLPIAAGIGVAAIVGLFATGVIKI